MRLPDGIELGDGMRITHGPDGGATVAISVGLREAPLDIVPVALEAAQALIEEAVQAAIDGMSIVWLVARVPANADPELRAELVRRAGAILSILNE